MKINGMPKEVVSHFRAQRKVQGDPIDVRKRTMMMKMLTRPEPGFQIQTRTNGQMWMDGGVLRLFTQMNMTLLQRTPGRLTPNPGFPIIPLKGGYRQRPPLPLPSTRKVCAVKKKTKSVVCLNVQVMAVWALKPWKQYCHLRNSLGQSLILYVSGQFIKHLFGRLRGTRTSSATSSLPATP